MTENKMLQQSQQKQKHQVHSSSQLHQQKPPLSFKQRQQSEQHEQSQFLRYFLYSFDDKKQIQSVSKTINPTNTNINSNNKMASEQQFESNLTFKTLSLGFYITAGDVWMRMFNKFEKIGEMEERFKRFSVNGNYNEGCQSYLNVKQKIGQAIIQGANLSYFASLMPQSDKWIQQPQQEISYLLEPHRNQLLSLFNSTQNRLKYQKLRTSIKLGSIVANVTETEIKSKQQKLQKQVSFPIRCISLCEQFYSELFLVWLVMSIKKSFNQMLFPHSCFIRYCDIVITSRMFDYNKVNQQNATSVNNNNTPSNKQPSAYHNIYRQFKLLCDNEWKKLMKDYMVALNDDKEVLSVLVKRIQEQLVARFNKEIQGKKSALCMN